MKLHRVLIVIVGCVLIMGAYLAFKISQIPPLAVHYHANFLVVKDGNLQDYSDAKYMDLEPCSLDEKKNFFEPEERAHLHDNIGPVVHVHAPGVKWHELFAILGIDGSTATYIVNGQPVRRLDQQDIHSEDRVLIVLGKAPADLQSYVDQIPTDAHDYNVGTKGVETCVTAKDETYSLWQRLRIAFGI